MLWREAGSSRLKNRNYDVRFGDDFVGRPNDPGYISDAYDGR